MLAGVRQPFMTSSFIFLIKLKHVSQKTGVSVTGTRGWAFSDFTRSETWRLNSTASFMPYKRHKPSSLKYFSFVSVFMCFSEASFLLLRSHAPLRK